MFYLYCLEYCKQYTQERGLLFKAIWGSLWCWRDLSQLFGRLRCISLRIAFIGVQRGGGRSARIFIYLYLGPRGSGGALTFHCYFLINQDNKKPSINEWCLTFEGGSQTNNFLGGVRRGGALVGGGALSQSPAPVVTSRTNNLNLLLIDTRLMIKVPLYSLSWISEIRL